MPSAFVDTGILLCAAGAGDDARAEAAAAIFRRADFGLSVQVLQEFAAHARAPGSGLDAESVNRWVSLLLEFECAVMDTDLFFTASRHADRFGIDYFDAALIAAAERIRAGVLYTETLAHGETYGRVRACNPFIEDVLA